MPKTDEEIHFQLDTIFFNITIGRETWSLETAFFDLSISSVFGIIAVGSAVIIGGIIGIIWFGAPK